MVRDQVRPSPDQPLVYHVRVSGPSRSAHSVCLGCCQSGRFEMAWIEVVVEERVGKREGSGYTVTLRSTYKLVLWC